MSARTSVVRSKIVGYVMNSYSQPGSWLGPLMRRVPLNATTRQVLSLTGEERRTYLDQLYRFNKAQPVKAVPPRTGLYGVSMAVGLIRRFNQLPCTVETRVARAQLLADVDPKTAKVLVLGDDDLLSIELAQRGFSGVTVADCDPRLVARIKLETAQLPTPPKVVEADFRRGFQADEPADVVFLDPPYSVDGALSFLSLAIAAAAKDRPSRIYLMINPDILGTAFEQVKAPLIAAGFRLKGQRRAFNGYPVGWLESTMMRITWRFLLHAPRLPASSRQLLFCSDCFEFVRP